MSAMVTSQELAWGRRTPGDGAHKTHLKIHMAWWRCGASRGVMLKGFWGCQTGITPTKGSGGRGGALAALGRPSLKHRLVFHNNSQLHNEKFAAVPNCRLLLNHFLSFCLKLDI